eukprot:Seg2307.4 transcript_id=Seg2307.4/GoldUCD/mRNA.D3Y31 product="Protein espinas" protein_id=Seg2307.4/GoldUCD/D3Y31
MSREEQKSLGHEKNAGAACLKCGPKCEGLDLHFWRKICNNCKCKLEEHDVKIQTKSIPLKIAKQKIIVDEGGKPNFPDKEIQVSVSLNNNEVSAQVAGPTKTVIQTSGANESFSDTTSSSGRSESASGIGSSSENAYGTGLVSEHGSDAASSSGVPPNTMSSSEFASGNSYNPGSASVLSNGTSAKEYSPDIGTSANSYDEEDLSAMPMPSPPESVRNSFTFVPEGANEDTVSKYLASIPKEKSRTSEEGSHYQQKQMMQQLPAHDFDEASTEDMTDQEVEKMMNFKRKRDEEASGQGAMKEQDEVVAAPGNCSSCDKDFESGGIVIFAKLAGPEKCWHPECFVCHTCQELLVDLIYFFHDGNIFCGRHYGEILGIRCAACDELIFTESYAQAEGLSYHTKHFCCFECDKELAGQKYVPKDGNPYCMECNSTKFSKTCHGCKNKIPPEEACYSYDEFFWHNDADCFNCCVCKNSLIGKEFVPKDGNIYCSANCLNEGTAI